MTRYAMYFAPAPESPLHRFGSAWLGRDAATGARLIPPALAGVSAERVAAMTAAPRSYGFHATLKPPFALSGGRTPAELVAAFQAFSRDNVAFLMPPLQLAEIGGFLALVPSAPSPQLTRLAERAVCDVDSFRAPPSSEEKARRMQASLDTRERELLDIWGYPYVLDRWRFHMTLTERLDPPERQEVKRALEPLVAPFCREPLCVDAVALFVQAERDASFVYQARFALRCAA